METPRDWGALGRQTFRAGGAQTAQSSEGFLRGCGTTRPPERWGAAPVPASQGCLHPPGRAGSVPHSMHGTGTESEFLDSEGPSWWPRTGSEMGRAWGSGGSGVTPTWGCLDRSLTWPQFLLPAGGSSMRPASASGAGLSAGGAGGTHLQAAVVLIADGGAWLPAPAQRPRLQPLSAPPGHRHSLWSRQAVSFPFSQLPPREAPEGVGALASVRGSKDPHPPKKSECRWPFLFPGAPDAFPEVSPERSRGGRLRAKKFF